MRTFARFLFAALVATTSGAAFAGAVATNVLVQSANTTDFGSVAVGQSATRLLTLSAPASNTQPVVPNLPTVPAGFAFVPGGTCDALTQLSPGQSCTTAVTFAPSSPTNGGGPVTASCQVVAVQVVAGFTLNCTTQATGQLALFVASAFNSAVPLMSPLVLTLLALGLLGFGARGALRRVRR